MNDRPKMASDSTDGDGLRWSNETYNISQLVDLFPLPALVRVSEGIYSEYDNESFSTGDCLKLHSCQRIEKVVAYPVNTTETNIISEDFKTDNSPLLIPLDYGSKARVLRAAGRRRRYPTVQQLIDEFPATVQVGAKAIMGKHLMTGCNIEILPKSILELVKTTKDKRTQCVSLICRYKDLEVILHPACVGDFSEPADGIHDYTLREIVKLFPLPQLIELTQNFSQEGKCVTKEANSALANISQFTGRFALDRKHEDRKVFGSHRLDLCPSMNGSTVEAYRKHRAVVLISWNSDAEFQIAENMDTSDYQSVISMNFLKDENIPELGGFYIDIVDSCKSQTVDANDYSYPDLQLLDFRNITKVGVSKDPPARPPRPGTKISASDNHALKHTASPLCQTINRPRVLPKPNRDSQWDYLVPLTEPSDYEIVTGDMMPPKQIIVPSRGNPSTGVSPQIKPSENALVRLHNYMDRTADSNITDKNIGVNVVNPTPSDVKQKVPPKVAPKTKVKVLPSTAEEQKGIVQPTLALKPTMDVSPMINQKKESVTTDNYEVPTLQSPDKSSEECNQHGGPWREVLKTLSVEKLKDCLRQLGFGHKSDIFSEQEIDGDYLISLYEQHTLAEAPFSLTKIEMMKLGKFIESGKLPLRDSAGTAMIMNTSSSST